jgi:hypothetical protein
MSTNAPPDLSPISVEAAYWLISFNTVMGWARKNYIGLYRIPGRRGLHVSRSEIRLALKLRGPRKMRSPRVSYGQPATVVELVPVGGEDE